MPRRGRGHPDGEVACCARAKGRARGAARQPGLRWPRGHPEATGEEHPVQQMHQIRVRRAVEGGAARSWVRFGASRRTSGSRLAHRAHQGGGGSGHIDVARPDLVHLMHQASGARQGAQGESVRHPSARSPALRPLRGHWDRRRSRCPTQRCVGRLAGIASRQVTRGAGRTSMRASERPLAGRAPGKARSTAGQPFVKWIWSSITPELSTERTIIDCGGLIE